MTNPCIVHTFTPIPHVRHSKLNFELRTRTRRTRMYSNYITPSNFIALTVTHLEVGDGTKQPYSLSIRWHDRLSIPVHTRPLNSLAQDSVFFFQITGNPSHTSLGSLYLFGIQGFTTFGMSVHERM